MKLAVGYPWSSPFAFTGFTEHLPNLQRPKDVDVRFFRGTGWCPARRHIDICEQALKWDADLICIIGADQVHPEDMLPRLYDRFVEGYEVISAMVPCRGYVNWQPMKPYQPMAWRFKTNDEMCSNKIREFNGMRTDPDMIHVITRNDGDVVKCNFIGSGVLMFHRDHLLALKKPWFFETINPEDMVREASMDCKFVWRLQQEANAVVWVDTTIMVKHLNVMPIDDTYQKRFADLEN